MNFRSAFNVAALINMDLIVKITKEDKLYSSFNEYWLCYWATTDTDTPTYVDVYKDKLDRDNDYLRLTRELRV